MNTHENEEFTKLLRSAVAEAEKLKYYPNDFKKMLDSYGGFDTVNRILASGKPSDGFTKLWELGHLDLTCEAVIVQTKWRRCFDASLVARAEKLPQGANYPFKRFDDEVGAGKKDEQARIMVSVPEASTPAAFDSVYKPSSASNIGINAFFREILHAPVANPRWSWGSVDERTRRVFLRLWRMDIDKFEGNEVIRVLGRRGSDRPGWSERVRHLDLIRSGYAAYAVVCDKDSPEAGVIRGFDHDTILRLGRRIDVDDMLHMEIAAAIPVGSVATPGSFSERIESDLREIEDADFNATTRSALVAARLGQGRFRRELLRRWNGACAVTGCRLAAILRASHCKPWRASDNHERLDSNNGLILSANLDALFDIGLISFDDDGVMLVGGAVTASERAQLGLPGKLLRVPGQRLRVYLKFHRDHIFLK